MNVSNILRIVGLFIAIIFMTIAFNAPDVKSAVIYVGWAIIIIIQTHTMLLKTVDD